MDGSPQRVNTTSRFALARIFHQNAELWRRTGRDRSGSTGAANRSLYWQGAPDSVSRRVVRAGARGPRLRMWVRVAMVRFRPKLAPAEKRPHARYGRLGPARIRVTPTSNLDAIRWATAYRRW